MRKTVTHAQGGGAQQLVRGVGLAVVLHDGAVMRKGLAIPHRGGAPVGVLHDGALISKGQPSVRGVGPVGVSHDGAVMSKA